MSNDQILLALRRAAENDYSLSVSPQEAAALVSEVERLRAWAEQAAAAENANAVAAERAAVVAFLTGENDARCRFISDHVAMRIERGEHRREETK